MTAHTQTTGLSIQVDGQSIPLREACWYAQAACGCRYAVTLAEVAGQVICATEEDATVEMLGPEKVRINRAVQDGTRVVLARRDGSSLDDCEHTPRFGRVDAVAPEGYEWATTDQYNGRQTHLRHVVPVLPDGDSADVWSARVNTAAVCGHSPATRQARRAIGQVWRVDRDAHSLIVMTDKLPCLRCVEKVNAMAGVSGDGA